MADSKISALAAVSSLADTDELILASAGTTKKITGANLRGATRPGYGTTLPASPVDGQEHILVDSLTNPTYQWRFRYNANSTAPYKWEFVGGAPLRSWVAASEGTTSTPYVDLTTVGPSITVPRSGEYFHGFGCSANGTNPGSALQISPSLGTGGQITVPGANYGAAMVVNGPLVALTAAQVVKLQYGVTFGGTGNFGGRWLELMPRRVS